MSTAMRSTLQTVPESLEVTKPNTTTQDAPAAVATKTPAKASGEAAATKSSRSYNYHAPSSTNKKILFLIKVGACLIIILSALGMVASQAVYRPITIKNQMMRLLRRSKSTAAAHTDKTTAKSPPGHHQPHHHYHHNHVVHPQHNRNGGMVVNMVEGVPLVVGGGIGGKSKKVQCMEHGQMRRKQRFHVVTFPEMIYEPTSDIVELIEASEKNEKFKSLVHMHPPPVDVLEQMEAKAAELHYKRKAKNGGKNPDTMFKVGELGEGKPLPRPIEGTVFNCSSKLWKRSVRKMPKSYLGATVKAVACCFSNSSNKADVKKCVKIIERKKDSLYIAEFWPWCLFAADLKKPFWKLMHKALGYKKLTISTLTYDLDIEDYRELLEKMREKEFLEMQEMARKFTPVARGL